MKDTSFTVNEIYRRRLMQQSPEERLRMACRMFAAARRIALAAARERGLVKPEEIRERLFLQIYGADFAEDDLPEILAGINRSV